MHTDISLHRKYLHSNVFQDAAMKKILSVLWITTGFLCLEALAVFSFLHLFHVPVVLGLATSLVVIHILLILFLRYFFHRKDRKEAEHRADVTDGVDIKRLKGELRDVTRKLQKQMYDLHTLFEVSIHLNSILEPQRLIESSMLSLLGQLQTNQTVIFLQSNNNRNAIYPLYSRGFSRKNFKDFALPLEDPVISRFGEKMIALDLLNLEEGILDEKWLKLIESGITMVAPIISKKQIRGLIGVGHKMNNELFTQPEQELFSLLAHFISVAFSNSILYQKMEQISVTDGLTGLHNYRYFKKRLDDEMERAARYNHSLSLVLFDVDHFKNFNDTLGHPAGDEALKTVANILKSTIRKSDIAVRYGGEEFCVILPEAEIGSAYNFAERLRKHIEKYRFEEERVQPGGKLTVSIGVASFPQDADSAQQLLEKADAALYKAKGSGRNKTCLASVKVS